MKPLAYVIGALLLAGLLWWLAIREPTSDPIAEAPDGDEPEAQPAPAGSAAPTIAPPPAAPSAAPAEPAAPSAAQPNDTPEQDQPIKNAPVPPPERMGPIDDLARQFEHEPRDSDASRVESEIQAAFRDKDIHPDLLRSVLCRESLCKLELRWTSDRNTGYMTGMMKAAGALKSEFAIDPVGPLGADGVQNIVIYQQRPKAATP